MYRTFLTVVFTTFTSMTALGQMATLSEEVKVGDTDRIVINLTVDGKIMTTGVDGKPDSLSLKATANHRFAERIDAVDERGAVSRSIRGYTACESEAAMPGVKTKRVLPANRKIIVNQKNAEGHTVYSPLGALTRDELDVTAGHLDSTILPGLLPGKAVNIGDHWTVPAAIVQALCIFDGLSKYEMTGTLTEIKDGKALFTIDGTVEGVEVGAAVKLKIAMKGTFDLTAKRITTLSIEESDVREQGPVAPACDVKAQLELTRTRITEEPAELTAADREKVPADGKIPVAVLALRHDDPTGKYGFFYSRDWYIVASSNDHLVMRLVDKGEFVAQATVLHWKKAAPGTHATVAEIKDAIAKQPGWVAEKMTEDGEIPTDAGRWLYRLVARGKQDDVAVQQSFHMLAGPNGDQLVITVIARENVAEKIGIRDVQLVNSIDFVKKESR
ncbi:MAG: hypothetical protein U0798_03080 [Gemmataceae bacterium]